MCANENAAAPEGAETRRWLHVTLHPDKTSYNLCAPPSMDVRHRRTWDFFFRRFARMQRNPVT